MNLSVPRSQFLTWSEAKDFRDLMNVILKDDPSNRTDDLESVKKVTKVIQDFFNAYSKTFTYYDLGKIKKIKNLVFSISKNSSTTTTPTKTSKSELEGKHDCFTLSQNAEKNKNSRSSLDASLTHLERTLEIEIGKLNIKMHNSDAKLGPPPHTPAAYSPLNYWINEFKNLDKFNQEISNSLRRAIEHATEDEICAFVYKILADFSVENPLLKTRVQIFFNHSTTHWHSVFFNMVHRLDSKGVFFAAVIKALPQNLTHLSFENTNIEDRHLQTILNCKNLKSLNLRGCSKLTDNGVKGIVEAAMSLDELILDNIPNLSEETFELVCNRI